MKRLNDHEVTFRVDLEPVEDFYLNSLCGLIFTHTSLHSDLISSVLNRFLFIPQKMYKLYSKFSFYDWISSAF